jgi:uncharacterized protein with von Willebrand factor type A (vWA) domain
VNDLSTNIIAFCALLRTEHHFSVGQPEARDALRALEAIGIADESRVRSALRPIFCGTQPQTQAFDDAFDAFFRPPPAGAAQPAYAPRHTRPGREQLPAGAERPAEPRPRSGDDGAEDDGSAGRAVREIDAAEPDAAGSWQMLRARYSPAAGAGPPPAAGAADFERMLDAAGRLITSLHLGRSRRWKKIERGGRFDLRRTIRASLQTGGDPVDLRFLGHPLRNPRVVMLIDGSRSMTEHTGAIVDFARALCARSTRAHVFFFSTGLRDVTRGMRAAGLSGASLGMIGEAWGGGTKIGAALDTFVSEHGPRLLGLDTLVMVVSDGLDGGDVPRLERAMRTLDRRSAAVVWLNPHADAPGYHPSARGMRAALPFITVFTAANDATAFANLARRLAREPRIAGHRR